MGIYDSQSQRPFYMAAPRSYPFKPVADAGNLPKSIKLQMGKREKEVPVAYLDKIIAVPGHWVNPDDGAKHDITPERLKGWAENFTKMQADGIRVHVPSDHSERARDNRGFIVSMALVPDASQYDADAGPGLLARHQMIGEDAALEALRNDTSIAYDPNYIGTNGKFYGDCIVHNALTPVPVSTGLSSFKQAASRAYAAPGQWLIQSPAFQHRSDSMNYSIPCSEEHMAKLRKWLPGGDQLTPEDVMARITQQLHTMGQSDDADAGDGAQTMSRQQIHEKAAVNRKAIKDEATRLKNDLETANTALAAERGKVSEMSRQIVQAPPADALAPLIDGATAAFEGTAKGGICPAVRKKLMSLLVRADDGKINSFAMSRQANPAGDKPLAMAVAAALSENVIVKSGEESGFQAADRNIPGDDPESSNRKEMARKTLNKYLRSDKEENGDDK